MVYTGCFRPPALKRKRPSLWAPAERDIAFFTGEPMVSFLDGYGQVRSLRDVSSDLFAFYIRCWRLDGVAFFGRRALLHDHPRSREAYPILAQFIAAATEPLTRETETFKQALDVARLHNARQPGGQSAR
jgi:hypothetical protein